MRRFRFSAITPFTAAAILLVLSAVPSVNTRATDKIEPWISAQISGNPDAVQRALVAGASRTAVHLAASGDAALDALPRMGGRPDVRDGVGNGSLRLASDATSPTARPNGGGGAPERKADVANGKGETSLSLASEAQRDSAGLLWSTAQTPGNLEIVRRLLASDVNPNVPDGVGRTAVHRAASGGAARILDALLRAGGKPDVRDSDGNTPLHIAIGAGGSKVEVVEALLAGGANPCVRNAMGRTPYRMAADGGSVRLALGRAGGHDRACGKNGERTMRVAARATVRSGPGPYYGRIGRLEVGYEVKVAGETGDWLRIEMPGGAGYVRAAQMIDTVLVDSLEPKCDGFSQWCGLCGTMPDLPSCRICREFPVCWKRLSNRPECYLLVDNDGTRDRSVTWAGSCSGGVANGKGKLSWSRSPLPYSGEDAGMLVDGKRHGLWIGRSGRVSDFFHFYTYVNGKKHGPWFRRKKTHSKISTQRIGTFVNGKSHGQSVDITNGNVSTGAYVNGKRHGQWITAGDRIVMLDDMATGIGAGAKIGAYMNGKRHGQWVELFDEVVQTGAYVDDTKHGQWKRRSITTCEIIEYESGAAARKRKC